MLVQSSNVGIIFLFPSPPTCLWWAHQWLHLHSYHDIPNHHPLSLYYTIASWQVSLLLLVPNSSIHTPAKVMLSKFRLCHSPTSPLYLWPILCRVTSKLSHSLQDLDPAYLSICCYIYLFFFSPPFSHTLAFQLLEYITSSSHPEILGIHCFLCPNTHLQVPTGLAPSPPLGLSCAIISHKREMGQQSG